MFYLRCMRTLLLQISLIQFSTCFRIFNTKATGILPIEGKLLMSSVVFRHGNRTPDYFYPKTHCKEHQYTDGVGELTETGQLFSYDLGQALRKRYRGFIKSKILSIPYNVQEVYSWAAEVDRCIHSAHLIHSALNTPTLQKFNWEGYYNWQSGIVRTAPGENDPVIRSQLSGCHKLNDMINERKESKEVKDLFEANRNLLLFLGNKTGQNITIDNIWVMHATLEIEYLMAVERKGPCKRKPDWLTGQLVFDLEKLVLSYFKIIYGGNDTEFLRTLGGPLVSRVVKSMKDVLNKVEKVRKVFLYSGHDLTIFHLISTLGIEITEYPPFSHAVLIELYSSEKGPTVHIFWQNMSNKAPSRFNEIPIPKCPRPCAFQTFVKNYNNVISVNREKECSLKIDGSSKIKLAAIVVMTLFISLLIYASVMTMLYLNSEVHNKR